MLQMTWLSQRLKVAIKHPKKTSTSIPQTFTNHCQIHKLELSTKGKVTSLKQPEIQQYPNKTTYVSWNAKSLFIETFEQRLETFLFVSCTYLLLLIPLSFFFLSFFFFLCIIFIIPVTLLKLHYRNNSSQPIPFILNLFHTQLSIYLSWIFIGKRQTVHFLKVQNACKISVWNLQKDLLKIIMQSVVISIINGYM